MPQADPASAAYAVPGVRLREHPVAIKTATAVTATAIVGFICSQSATEGPFRSGASIAQTSFEALL